MSCSVVQFSHDYCQERCILRGWFPRLSSEEERKRRVAISSIDRKTWPNPQVDHLKLCADPSRLKRAWEIHIGDEAMRLKTLPALDRSLKWKYDTTKYCVVPTTWRRYKLINDRPTNGKIIFPQFPCQASLAVPFLSFPFLSFLLWLLFHQDFDIVNVLLELNRFLAKVVKLLV